MEHDLVHNLNVSYPERSYWFCSQCDEIWENDDGPDDSDECQDSVDITSIDEALIEFNTSEHLN